MVIVVVAVGFAAVISTTLLEIKAVLIAAPASPVILSRITVPDARLAALTGPVKAAPERAAPPRAAKAADAVVAPVPPWLIGTGTVRPTPMETGWSIYVNIPV
jgi:hypothetical protein